MNSDGWAITAAHAFTQLILPLEQALTARQKHEAAAAQIRAADLPPKERANQLRALGWLDPDSPTHTSTWWGHDGLSWKEASYDPDADLALVRLNGFKPEFVKSYPVFKNATDGKSLDAQGTSLCRLGFPFAELETTYDAAVNGFRFDPRGRLAAFPVEGILTREVVVEQQPGKLQRMFLETSSPGLKGQSGGPIFDRNGVVWAMQVRTDHYYLGFNPPNPEKKKEYQFLNVGLGTHAARITALLEAQNVPFQKEKS